LIPGGLADWMLRVLECLANHDHVTAAELGVAMGLRLSRNPRALIRAGETMGKRLVRLNLAREGSTYRHGLPAWVITPAGLTSLRTGRLAARAPPPPSRSAEQDIRQTIL